MTPKEKAIELVDKFYQYLPIERDVTTSEGELSWEYHGWGNAKQCALIAVNLLIESTPSMNIYPPNCQTKNPKVKEYWKDVKQEIEKL